MKLKVEPFIDGFMKGIKPQIDGIDAELFSIFFRNHRPYSFSSGSELLPSKCSYYFRFGRAHLNVLLPTWLMNGKKSNSKDRFRIGSTVDHSVIVDTKESLIYDPTTEVSYTLEDYRPFSLADNWKEETRFRILGELKEKRLSVRTLSDRFLELPFLYDPLTAFIMKNRLKSRFPDFVFGLKLSEMNEELNKEERHQRMIFEWIAAELHERTLGKAA